VRFTWRATRRLLAGGLAALGLLMMAPGSVTAAGNGTTQRPVQDFLDAQYANLPYIIDFVSGSTGALEYRSRVDFLGVIANLVAAPNGADFESTYDGSVTERVRSDGKTEVHVIVRGHHVCGTVFDGVTPSVAATVWGQIPLYAIANDLPMSFCDSHFELTYATDDPPGSDLAWFVGLLAFPEEGQEIIDLKVHASGVGELREAFGVPDGTPGMMTMHSMGLTTPAFTAGHADNLPFDGRPVANLKLQPVGN